MNSTNGNRQAHQYAGAIQTHVRQSQMATHAVNEKQNFISYVDQKHVKTTQELGGQMNESLHGDSTDASDDRFRLPNLIA